MTDPGNSIPDWAKEVSGATPRMIAYSICTLVTDADQYGRMLGSFREAGFSPDDCEFLYLDNRGENRFDGYRGLNRLIFRARGAYVILCHQDVLAIDPRSRLEECLAELDRVAPDWAVAGNAGYDATRKKRFRLSHPYAEDMNTGGLPAPVVSLDENFLLVRRDALIGFSHDLSGFHLYGPDLVTQAGLRGHSAWVIDYHLRHLGGGQVDQAFMDAVAAFQEKYRRALRHRAIRSTVTKLALGGWDPEALYRNWLKRFQVRTGKKPLAALAQALRLRKK